MIGWQAAESPIFGWNDDVEAPGRTGYEALLGEAVQSESGRGGGDAKRGPGFSAGEVVSSTGGKVVDQGDRSRGHSFRFHSRKLSFYDALSKQNKKIGPQGNESDPYGIPT